MWPSFRGPPPAEPELRPPRGASSDFGFAQDTCCVRNDMHDAGDALSPLAPKGEVGEGIACPQPLRLWSGRTPSPTLPRKRERELLHRLDFDDARHGLDGAGDLRRDLVAAG